MTPLSDPVQRFMFVMNVILEVWKGDASCVEGSVPHRHITVENVSNKKRTEMAVLELSTLVQPAQICFMSGRNMASKSVNIKLS